MRKILIIVMCITFGLFTSSCEAKPQQPLDVQQITIVSSHSSQEHIFNVEVAKRRREIQFGLMYRTELGNDEGMLFVFNDTKPRSFWMRNTFIPLDIIFIQEGGVIGHIHRNAKPLDETLIPSVVPANKVLELNAGICEKLNIQIGDKVIF